MEVVKRTQANEIVTALFDLFKPDSVADIGCGTATLLYEFKKRGVSIRGYDGKWANKELLYQNILPKEFIECDLEKPLSEKSKVDLAVCLEVAEHLSSQRADGLVEDLTSISDIIIFSAAIPRQGGQNHINEQWPEYWEGKFMSRGYTCHDVLKSIFWDNEKILWWYRQNMVLYVKNGVALPSGLLNQRNYLKNVIHPVLFTTVVDYRQKNAIKRFARGLWKSVLYKLKIIK